MVRGMKTLQKKLNTRNTPAHQKTERFRMFFWFSRSAGSKEVLTPMKGDSFIFPVADGTVENFVEDQYLKTFTLILDRQRRRTRLILEENQTGLQLHFKTHCDKVIFGRSREISFTVTAWNPE